MIIIFEHLLIYYNLKLCNTKKIGKGRTAAGSAGPLYGRLFGAADPRSEDGAAAGY